MKLTKIMAMVVIYQLQKRDRFLLLFIFRFGLRYINILQIYSVDSQHNNYYTWICKQQFFCHLTG